MICTGEKAMNTVNFGLLKTYFVKTFKEVGSGAEQKKHVVYLYESLFKEMEHLMKYPECIDQPSWTQSPMDKLQQLDVLRMSTEGYNEFYVQATKRVYTDKARPQYQQDARMKAAQQVKILTATPDARLAPARRDTNVNNSTETRKPPPGPGKGKGAPRTAQSQADSDRDRARNASRKAGLDSLLGKMKGKLSDDEVKALRNFC